METMDMAREERLEQVMKMKKNEMAELIMDLEWKTQEHKRVSESMAEQAKQTETKFRDMERFYMSKIESIITQARASYEAVLSLTQGGL